jgi:hypothetical protein
MGAKTDLEIFGLIAKEMHLNLGIWLPDKVLEEIRKTVHGYNVPLPVLATGGAAPTMPLNGRVAALPGAIQSAGDTKVLNSVCSPPASLSRYSKILNSVDGSAPAADRPRIIERARNAEIAARLSYITYRRRGAHYEWIAKGALTGKSR